jgi:hypothetical protein
MNLPEHSSVIICIHPRAAAPKIEDVPNSLCASCEPNAPALVYESLDGDFGDPKVLFKLQPDVIGKAKIGELQEFVVSRATPFLQQGERATGELYRWKRCEGGVKKRNGSGHCGERQKVYQRAYR